MAKTPEFPEPKTQPLSVALMQQSKDFYLAVGQGISHWALMESRLVEIAAKLLQTAPIRLMQTPTTYRGGSPIHITTAKGGDRAYRGRLGKDRSPGESRHSIASPKYALLSCTGDQRLADDALRTHRKSREKDGTFVRQSVPMSQ